jgi:hypothetical protein
MDLILRGDIDLPMFGVKSVEFSPGELKVNVKSEECDFTIKFVLPSGTLGRAPVWSAEAWCTLTSQPEDVGVLMTS